MQSKRKSNSIVTTTRLESGAIQFSVLGAGTLTFDFTKADESMRAHAEIHGWIQRISDAAAIGRDEETGKPATPEAKLARMKARVDHYESGAAEWRISGAGGGGRSDVVMAFQRYKNIATYEMAKESIERHAIAKGRTYEEQVKVFGAAQAIQDIIIEMQRERFANPVADADGELEELTNAG